MKQEEIKKKVEQIILLKGWYPLEFLEKNTASYNPFFDDEYLIWLQQKEFLTPAQIQEIKQLLSDSELGNTLQISPEQNVASNLSAVESLPTAILSTKPNPQNTLPPTLHLAQADTIAMAPPPSSQKINADNIPSVVGNYEILEKIGQGGMGKVYKARHTFLDKLVAFKVLNHLAHQNQNYVTRFFREAKAASALNHANIIRCLDAGVLDQIYYLAMEYVEGETLASAIQKKQFSETEILRIALDITRALDYASSHGIIHRDLKPENIMISTTGNVMLLDLGLAKALGDSTLTMEGTLLGTPYYMSPEQCRGDHQITVAADLYSLGATLYHLFTGEVPFKGENPLVIINQHIHIPVPSLLHKKPDLDPRINQFVQKLMAKDIADRYANPKEVENVILQILEPTTSFPLPQKKSRLEAILPTSKSPTKTNPITSPSSSPAMLSPTNSPEKESDFVAMLGTPLNQSPASNPFVEEEPTTQKFQFPASNPFSAKPASTAKTSPLPPSEEDLLNKLKVKVPTSSSSLSYSASSKKVESTKVPHEAESFVNPFPTQKKKSPQLEGFIPGNQLYHGNWGSSPQKEESVKPIFKKRPIAWKKGFRRIFVVIFLGICGYFWFFQQEWIKIQMQKGEETFQKVKQKMVPLFKSEEIAKVEVTNRSTLTEEQKAEALRKESIENLLKEQNDSPQQEAKIYAKYQKLLKNYENTPEILLLEPEWNRFYRNYLAESEQIAGQYEKKDFYDRHLFQFEVSIKRWTDYLHRFSPLELAQSRGKERLSYFQNLKKSAENKYYSVSYKGFETLWKNDKEFHANCMNTTKSQGYDVFDTTLKVSLEGRNELRFLMSKLQTNQYLLHFQAQLEKKGFVFLYHYENQTKFNKQVFLPKFPGYSSEKWYLFRLHVQGKQFHWYIFEKDSEQQGQFLLLAKGEQKGSELQSEQGIFGFHFPFQSACTLETVRILKIEE